MRALRRLPFVFLAAAALIVGLPKKEAQACADPLSGALCLAVWGAAVVVSGTVALIVEGVEAMTDDDGGASAGRPGPAPASAVDAASIETAADRAYAARPACDEVGGYEAYLQQTGKLCRLY